MLGHNEGFSLRSQQPGMEFHICSHKHFSTLQANQVIPKQVMLLQHANCDTAAEDTVTSHLQIFVYTGEGEKNGAQAKCNALTQETQTSLITFHTPRSL